LCRLYSVEQRIAATAAPIRYHGIHELIPAKRRSIM
jgi:hypothetical protein